jgi:hypothetical protein
LGIVKAARVQAAQAQAQVKQAAVTAAAQAKAHVKSANAQYLKFKKARAHALASCAK